VGFGYDAYYYGALLYGFSGVFDLEDPALGGAGEVRCICHCREVDSQSDTVIVVIISEHDGGVLWRWRGDERDSVQ
jgi:hypothetical protein